MTETISANFSELLKQASMTAHDYMHAAVRNINEFYGDGYAEKNPVLVGAFMQTAAHDFGMAVLAQQIRVGLNQLAEYVDHSELMAGIKSGLDNIANNLGHDDDAVAEAIERLARAVEDSFSSLEE